MFKAVAAHRINIRLSRAEVEKAFVSVYVFVFQAYLCFYNDSVGFAKFSVLESVKFFV